MLLARVLRPFHQSYKALGMCNPNQPWINRSCVHQKTSVHGICNFSCTNLMDVRLEGHNRTSAIKKTVAVVLPTYQVRWYAKKSKKEKKDKGGKKSAKVRVELSDEELQEVIDFQGMKAKMEQTLLTLKQEYASELSVRTNAGVFEQLMVGTPDGKFPLLQLGQVAQKGPDTIIINMTAMPQYLPAVKEALLSSGMNLNPQQDGLFIFVPLPKVTREHREALVKSAKVLCDRTKDKLRDIQNSYLRIVKKKKDEHSSDLIHNLQETIHASTHEFTVQAEDLMAAKQQELQVTK